MHHSIRHFDACWKIAGQNAPALAIKDRQQGLRLPQALASKCSVQMSYH